MLGVFMLGPIFVDREKELLDLKKFYEAGLRGALGGLIIYGWRKVGKTLLVDKFLESVPGFRINCAWISDPETFATIVSEKLVGFIGSHKLIDRLRILIHEEKNPMLLLRETFDVINSSSEIYGKKLVVALDEIHKFLDKISTRIAREVKKSKEVVYSDVLWMLKDIIEKKKVFWILLSSLGWVKLRELLEIKKIRENPLLGLLAKYEVKPLTIDGTKQLVKARNRNIPERVIEEIHRISGGIPILVDLISTLYTPEKGLLDLVTSIIQQGFLDEFFENLIKFIAEVMKRDYTIVIKILKAFKSDYITPEEAAEAAHLDRTSTYILLEELVKCGILSKEKIKREVRYRILYPLIRLWLDTRIEPRRKIFEILASRLGITAEYYIQELLKKFEGKEIALYDDDKGTFLLGTIDKISYKVRKVYDLEETAKLLGHRNADLLIELENNEYLLIEVKARLKDIEPEDIIQLDRAKKYLEEKTGRRTHAAIILLGTGKATLPAVREAILRKIAIITQEAIKILAKKTNMPYY